MGITLRIKKNDKLYEFYNIGNNFHTHNQLYDKIKCCEVTLFYSHNFDGDVYDYVYKNYKNKLKKIVLTVCDNISYDYIEKIINNGIKSLVIQLCCIDALKSLDKLSEILYHNTTLKTLKIYELNTIEIYYEDYEKMINDIVMNSYIQKICIAGCYDSKKIIIPLEERNVPLNSNSKSAAKNN